MGKKVGGGDIYIYILAYSPSIRTEKSARYPTLRAASTYDYVCKTYQKLTSIGIRMNPLRRHSTREVHPEFSEAPRSRGSILPPINVTLFQQGSNCIPINVTLFIKIGIRAILG